MGGPAGSLGWEVGGEGTAWAQAQRQEGPAGAACRAEWGWAQGACDPGNSWKSPPCWTNLKV